MDLKIPYVGTKDAKAAFKVVETFLSQGGLAHLPFKPKFDFDAANNKIVADGSGFKIIAVFQPQHLEINLELSLLYRAFKGKVISLLEDQLKKKL